MFEALGRAVVRRRRFALSFFVVGLVVAAILDFGLFSRSRPVVSTIPEATRRPRRIGWTLPSVCAIQ